jgi:hypothetical protein
MTKTDVLILIVLSACLLRSNNLFANNLAAPTIRPITIALASDESMRDIQTTKPSNITRNHSRLRQFGGNIFVQGLVYLLLSGTGWFIGSRGVGGPNFQTDMALTGSISVASVIAGGGILLATNQSGSIALLENENAELTNAAPRIALGRKRDVVAIVSLATVRF